LLVVRTAATNLADFTDQRLGMVAFLVLGLLLVAALTARFFISKMLPDRQPGEGVLSRVDGLYWATMLVAGTLGTALGDFSSFRSGLGLAGASLALSAPVVLLVGPGRRRPFPFPPLFWGVVVAARHAGP